MVAAWVFLGLVWWPIGPPDATVVIIRTKAACERLVTTFTVSQYMSDDDEPKALQGTPSASCQAVVRPSEDGDF